MAGSINLRGRHHLGGFRDACDVFWGYSGKALHTDYAPQPIAVVACVPAVFGRLIALRSLVWKCEVSFDLNSDVPSAGLPNLTDLTVAKCDPSFFGVLSRMRLPSLRTLVAGEKEYVWEVIRDHGQKLVDVTCCSSDVLSPQFFEHCPNVKSLTLYFHRTNSSEFPEATAFSSDGVLANQLNKISVKSGCLVGICFPSLREVEVNSCKWPINERDIAKNQWVRWAEGLLETGISLSDKNGKKWRPRLKNVLSTGTDLGILGITDPVPAIGICLADKWLGNQIDHFHLLVI
ncbi:hypothetical protein FB45DRAFT_871033 [Roridomyces roridus]|uniref:Uncharacterized protein n=1 Tax=Roridomyces roridus TaxID=1738132 RepID=A0AAD7BI67_9AGAR|nr:hypothetical protein FB45DRAFT_871033 [Roridomyces roridus]